MRVRFKDAVSIVLAVLAFLPFTAPFSTFDLKSHGYDLCAPQAEVMAAKTCAGEGSALLGRSLVEPDSLAVFVMMMSALGADESSKHQIPSRILRL